MLNIFKCRIMGIVFLFAVCGLHLNAQDVQLIVPKLSIENAIKTFIDARGASMSSYTSGFGVDMWNVKLIYSGSHPLVVNLIPPNRFRIQCGIIARANVDYIVGNFQINGEGDITLEGVISAEGNQGQIKLLGSADAVIQITGGIPGFLLNMINANQFTIRLPAFELGNFVYTLPYIPSNYFTTNYPTVNISNDNIILGLQTPNNFLVVDQRAEDGSRIIGSQIGHWSASTFQHYTVPKVFSNLPINSYQTFRGSQELLLNPSQKYNRWNDLNNIQNHQTFLLSGDISRLNSNFKKNHSGVTLKNVLEGTNVTGGHLFFRDPWFIDYEDPNFGGQKRNRGMDSAEFRPRSSPFYPDYTTIYDGGNKYLGVFLDQVPDPQNPNKPYYSAWAGDHAINLGSPIGIRQFYLLNWTATGATLQSSENFASIVFTSSNAVVNVNYKGQGLSNQTDAYTSNSQRKAVRLENSNLLLSIYKSLNHKVWIEQSDNNGASWSLKYGINPFDNDGINEYSTPSIDYIPSLGQSHPFAAVVHNALKLSVLRSNSNLSYYSQLLPNNWSPQTYGPEYIFPVVSATSSRILVLCNEGVNQYLQVGIAYYYGTISYSAPGPFVVNWTDGHLSPEFKIIPGTTQNSKNITVVADKNAGNIFHIAWQEGNIIKYCKATGSGSSLSFGAVETVSESNIFSKNRNPSISLANGNPVVSWTGSDIPVAEKIAAKDNFESELTPRVVVRRKGSSWGDLQIAGNNVNYSNNNSASSITEKTVIVWSEGSTNPQSKWMKRTSSSYSTPKNLSHSGIQAQVIRGGDYDNMTSIVFNNNQQPYYFSKTTTDFSVEDKDPGGGLNKISSLTDTVVTFGRAGIVNINGVVFVFNVGDIIVEDSIIAFIEKPDTLISSSAEEMNAYTKSSPFELNSSSNFYFSNIFYVVNKDLADSALAENDNVNFKAELVRLTDGVVVGEFDNITYNKQNLSKYASISYQVNCSGIQPGEYYLRLVTSVEGASIPGGTSYALANIMNESPVLEKISGSRAISFTGDEQPLAYELFQNYPNPFNPSTTIRYTIPNDGFVSLKVYDILGKEVTHLVNEHKTAGNYEVNFNAGNLASGVYIYQLRVKDYVSTKKMMLVK